MDSFSFITVHPPTLIRSSAHLDKLNFISKGNELVLVQEDENEQLNLSKNVTLKFFSDISVVRVLTTSVRNVVVILTDENDLFLAEYKDMFIDIYQKLHINNKLGKKTLKIMCCSSKYIVCYVNNRTFNVFCLNDSGEIIKAFGTFVSYDIIYDIVYMCENKFSFIGKNINGVLEFVIFEIEENDICFDCCIEIDKEFSDPCIQKISNNRIVISSMNNLYIIENDSIEKTRVVSFNIKSMLNIKDGEFVLCDYDGNIYNLNIDGLDGMENNLLYIQGIDRFIKLSSHYLFALGNNADTYLLKYNKSDLSVVNSYVALTSSKELLRSILVTSTGKVRTIENGCSTDIALFLKVMLGKKIFAVDNIIIVSTFDKTYILDQDYKICDKIHFEKDESTIGLSATATSFTQITPSKIRIISRADNSHNEITLDNAVSCCSYDGNLVAIAYNNIIKLFDNGVFIKDIVYDKQISVLDMRSNLLAVSFWESNIIFFESLETGERIDIQLQNFVFATSLCIVDKSSIYIGSNDTLYHFSNNVMVKVAYNLYIKNIKMLGIHPFIVSNNPGFILNNNKIKYVESPSLLDAAQINDNTLIFLTDEGIYKIQIQSNYDSHIIDRHIENFSICCSSLDDFDTNPIAFGGKHLIQSYVLVSGVGYKELKNNETPVKIMWIQYNSDPLLCVLCDVGSKCSVILFDKNLNRLASFSLTGTPYSICFVDAKYIAVAHQNKISILEYDGLNLVEKSNIGTQFSCASMTSPNSPFVIYADNFSSVILFTVIDGKIIELTRNMSRYQLDFAAALNQEFILGVEKSGNAIIFRLAEDKLQEYCFFNIGSSFVTGISSLPISFITNNGSLKILAKTGSDELVLYNKMKKLCFDLTGKTNECWRTVTKSINPKPTGVFVDGDLLLEYRNLPELIQSQIQNETGFTHNQIDKIITNMDNHVISYKSNNQYTKYF